MRLTERDLCLMQWLHKFAYVSIEQLQQKMHISKSTIYSRLHKLVEANYLQHRYILHGLPGIYFLTKKGCKLVNNFLPQLQRIAIANYRHDLMVINLAIYLENKYNVEYISERQLRSQSNHNYNFSHLPDGEIYLQNKHIAIEVELTRKSSRRIQKILQYYSSNLHYSEVWYFYDKIHMQQFLQQQITQHSFVRLHDLNTILQTKYQQHQHINFYVAQR